MAFAKRAAILGTGFGTRVTARALRAEGWQVTALFSRRAERAAQIAAKLGVPHAGDDARALIERDDVDAVFVATPTSTHRDLVLTALAAGKHVLCEKPFALNLAHAREMRQAAAGAALTTLCNFEFRYSDDRLQISQLVAEGLIGTPRSATATLYFARPLPAAGLDWRSRAEMGGGALNEHGSHYIDALRGWMGEITQVSARLATHEPQRIDPQSEAELTADADDFVSLQLGFASGALATVVIVWGSRLPAGGELHLSGEGGSLRHRSANGLFAPGILTHTPGLSPESPFRPLESDALPYEPPDSSTGPMIEVASRRLVRVFAEGIAQGRSPAPNFEDGLATQAVLDAARESARQGRTVEIEELLSG